MGVPREGFVTGILFGVCYSGDGSRFRAVAEPFLRRVATDVDRVVALPGDDRGICAVYNELIIRSIAMDADALVLVQDDVEIHDAQFRTAVLHALQDPEVGIVGVVGGRDVASLEWWRGTGVGGVFETRGPIFFPDRSGDVEVVGCARR